MIVEFKRPNLDELDIQRLKQNIYSVVDYVKDYITKNPTLSKEQLLINLENEFVNNANEYYFIIQELAGTNVQAIVTDYLLKNEDILKTKYNKLMRKKIVEDKNAIYTYDIEKSSKILIKSLLSLIRENLQKHNKTLSGDEEYEVLKKLLTTIKPRLASLQKKDNIKILRNAKDFFDDYNILEKLTNQYNHQLSSLWLDDLGYNLEPTAENPNDIGVHNFFSEEYLSKMSLENLSVLNIFWQNKYAKELANINFGYFAFQQLDLYNKLSSDSLKISNKTISNLFYKYKILENISKQIYASKSVKSNINPSIKENYKSYFKKMFPNMNNNLNEDLDQCINRLFASRNIYAIKSNLITRYYYEFN